MIEADIERFGAIDALMNNAGFGQFGVFETTPCEKIAEQFEVNVFGVMDTIRTILPHFRSHPSGSIVNVSSGTGMFMLPMISPYCAGKSAFALSGRPRRAWVRDGTAEMTEEGHIAFMRGRFA